MEIGRNINSLLLHNRRRIKSSVQLLGIIQNITKILQNNAVVYEDTMKNTPSSLITLITSFIFGGIFLSMVGRIFNSQIKSQCGDKFVYVMFKVFFSLEPYFNYHKR